MKKERAEYLEIDLFVCECGSNEHQFILRKFKEEDEIPEDFYLSVYLASHNFWKRLKIGIMYILGFKSRYGAFQEFILSPKEAERLSKILMNT